MVTTFYEGCCFTRDIPNQLFFFFFDAKKISESHYDEFYIGKACAKHMSINT